MPFISYAQNAEDVILWRALREVGRGCYIDAGAADPDVDSVTRAFYERGWRGINIEPDPALHARLARERPEDVNLQVGLAEQPGEGMFYIVGKDSGLSTFISEIAEVHEATGLPAQPTIVPILTLAQVCDAHVQGAVHFLKIDVEGSERAVLEGADFIRWRPWVIVLEATFPNSQVPSYGDWEPLLLCAGYRFAMFDGLNRFYVAGEHWESLSERFSYPCCVFDNYVTARQQAGWSRATQLETETAERAVQADINVTQLRGDIDQRDRQIARLNEAVVERDRSIAGLYEDFVERDHTIARLDQAVVERDRQIARLDQAVADRDRQFARLDEAVVDRDRVIAGLHECFVERDHTIAGLDQAVVDRDRNIALLQECIVEHDRIIAVLQEKLLERDHCVAKLAAQIDELQQSISHMQASMSWRITAPLRWMKQVGGAAG